MQTSFWHWAIVFLNCWDWWSTFRNTCFQKIVSINSSVKELLQCNLVSFIPLGRWERKLYVHWLTSFQYVREKNCPWWGFGVNKSNPNRSITGFGLEIMFIHSGMFIHAGKKACNKYFFHSFSDCCPGLNHLPSSQTLLFF